VMLTTNEMPSIFIRAKGEGQHLAFCPNKIFS